MKDCYKAEKTFKADSEKLHQVQEFMEDTLQKYGCSAKIMMQIDLVMEEVFMNIVHYAYPDSEGTCTVMVDFDGEKEVIITVEDSGIPFNPLEIDSPDITLPAEKREIGGLGIWITKQMMDKVEYRYEAGKNILKMVKLMG